MIQCCLVLKINYRLRLRQSTGFMSSLFFLLGKGHFLVPDYTTLCAVRRVFRSRYKSD
ncbi:MAG: transposase [Dysgonamonadaceae bacterium]|nr:transposase [Dysgonamonadaceae bacterium]